MRVAFPSMLLIYPGLHTMPHMIEESQDPARIAFPYLQVTFNTAKDLLLQPKLKIGSSVAVCPPAHLRTPSHWKLKCCPSGI